MWSDELAEPVRAEYDRWYRIIGPEDPYISPTTLGIHDVLRAHFLIADFFYAEGEGIGGIGPKSIDLLHSALARQEVGYGGQMKWTNKYEVAATLLFGLIKNHPFHDANKRTAFLSVLYLLHKNGRCPSVSADEFEKFTVEIAEDKIRQRKRYIALAKSSDDPDIKFIAKILRNKTRKIDKKQYTITYRELRNILHRFNYDIESPSGSYIDVVRVEIKRKLLTGSKEHRTKVGRIGYPGETRQVSKSDLKRVRMLTKLTVENGVDSQSFFRGLDDMNSLLTVYQNQLRSLADQ